MKDVSLWVPAVTQCKSHILKGAKAPHVAGILHRRVRMLRERSDRAVKSYAPLIYRLTNDPVFNDVPLTIQMGQFAVDPEIQSWRDWRLSLCSDQLLQTWLQSMRHTWQWSWPWSGEKMTEREKAVAAPETHFLFKDNFSCLFFFVPDIKNCCHLSFSPLKLVVTRCTTCCQHSSPLQFTLSYVSANMQYVFA